MGILDLFKAWRGEDLLSQTTGDFARMIESTHWMYRTAVDVLWAHPGDLGKKKEIRERDIEVNKTERAIRKKIVQHLAINPGSEVNYCLVLMSVVKDAERLGDYCKNLIEVAEYYDPSKDENPPAKELRAFKNEIESMYQEIGDIFRTSDQALAERLIKNEVDLAKRCDKMIEGILKTEGLTIPQAVTYTLLARYSKRLAAHLANIATSVIMPIHKLDYFDEDSIGKADLPKG